LTGSIGGANKQAKQSQGGAVVDSVDEVQTYGFGNDHSEEWDRPIQDQGEQSFLDDFMTSFDLKPND